MRFGTVAPTFPPISEVSKTAKRLEEKGYSSLWFADHLMGWYPHDLWKETVFAMKYPSCHMFYDAFCAICYASTSTERINLGTGVTEVFRRHPAVLLQQAVTADHATNGRFILGIGAGEAENTVPYGIEFKNHVSRLEEALELMKIMLETDYGETINFEGRFYRFRNAVFDLKPIRKVPIWIGAHGDRMLKLTAKYGDGWLPTTIPPEEYARKAEKLDQYAGDKTIEKALFVSLVIDESEKGVENILRQPIMKVHALLLPSEYYRQLGYEHPLGKFYGLLDYIPTNYNKEEILSLVEKIPDEVVRLAYVAGTLEEVIQKFDEYARAGVEHFVIWNLTYFGDVTKLKTSYQLIDELMTHFKS
ncbi:Coenzyme F420-dependent N5,N10-methylene tetrahydromethanopterin reductase-related flavin-dependent oxidoreductase [Archaeoglobus sulfaticallidus PM70-1]|uniref:Coenzyme F420-dependent N5,N10-methylene tetrahydromethanopterin reductase-related flavin-dependent oxidoreductase n=1 Tax=Archaeoglobus sulfaticallidus PM70-1 TaxID=387631 RepID=N0BN46_9EURY|nr:LLM class flavin-dependent oxidoreductase [Archaeoglobus sulfaticallidus]AGK61725.1 Coenzyme F420-dependent N5,N10-methylene tetrahydromethanopterin reductase-related flavin-dependent oxidoreductase [Archaeoglobus sulfaticallidus PM70-1]